MARRNAPPPASPVPLPLGGGFSVRHTRQLPHPASLASAASGDISIFSPVRRFFSSTTPAATPLGPSTTCHGMPSRRSEEHTSELQSLMRISYAVFCLKTKKNKKLSNR